MYKRLEDWMKSEGLRASKLADNIDVNLKFPVCLKMLSTEIEHKSDVGAISLNIKNYTKLKSEFQKMP